MAERIAIIGAGIVGLATAYRLQQRIPGAHVTVLEKEAGIARHQSSHNSGVLHCGLYYKPGSRRARLAVRGIRQMIEFCQTHAIPHEVCGKVVVATGADELPRLWEVREQAARALKDAGFKYVSVDLEPFRSGRLNEAAGLVPIRRR